MGDQETDSVLYEQLTCKTPANFSTHKSKRKQQKLCLTPNKTGISLKIRNRFFQQDCAMRFVLQSIACKV